MVLDLVLILCEWFIPTSKVTRLKIHLKTTTSDRTKKYYYYYYYYYYSKRSLDQSVQKVSGKPEAEVTKLYIYGLL